MTTLYFRLTLLSDTAFGRGEGVAGLVDAEIEHDANGLPFLHGRGVKGLFTAQCANLLYSLRQQKCRAYDQYEAAADALFGNPGSTLATNGIVHFGTAWLADSELREAVQQAIRMTGTRLKREDVIGALTAIRRQTRIDAETGAAAENTLRSLRVIIRDLQFEAALDSDRDLTQIEQSLLAACTRAIRRVGAHRSRGLGAVSAELLDDKRVDVVAAWMKRFAQEVMA
jgi:CRISPR/Cas system CSM-associated protein Csm3 (group 7 of RAMP superfamily)